MISPSSSKCPIPRTGKDTGIKLRAYERSGLANYWVVDLSNRRVEVRALGSQGFSAPVYYHENDEIPIVLDGRGLRADSCE